MTINSISTMISLVHDLKTKELSYFMEVATYGYDDNGKHHRQTLIHTQVSRPSQYVLDDCRKQFIALKKRGAEFSYKLDSDYTWAKVELTEKTWEE